MSAYQQARPLRAGWDTLALLGHFLRLSCGQSWPGQRLPRCPEPDAVTDDPEAVRQYTQAPASRLALTYACGLSILHRARSRPTGGTALDLGCGPGHFTLGLARHLGCDSVLGIDLSPGMVEAARHNAAAAGLGARARFCVGDATELAGLPAGVFDLATCTNGAHHLPDLAAVTRMLGQMDRLTRPDGLVLVLDLARLRTARLSASYADVVGRDYARRGLGRLLADFRSSLHAAWTVEELRRAVPRDTRRWWCQLVPAGLPVVQALLGLPEGRRRAFVRRGAPWPEGELPVPAQMRCEWHILRAALALGSRHYVAPGA
jgi:ubiquinone/menaquinone biosynthesis C-methylase UbiE